MLKDLRRNQRRIAELNSSIRKLEDRNSLLVDERNELVAPRDDHDDVDEDEDDSTVAPPTLTPSFNLCCS